MSEYYYCSITDDSIDFLTIKHVIELDLTESMTEKRKKLFEFGFMMGEGDVFGIRLEHAPGLSLGTLDLSKKQQNNRFRKILKSHSDKFRYLISDNKNNKHTLSGYDIFKLLLNKGNFKKPLEHLNYVQFYEVGFDN